MISLNQVSKSYCMGGQVVHALREVTLHIDRGDFVAFIGTSGSGKSTMMNIVGCLDRVSTGSYLLNGRDVAEMSSDELAAARNAEIGFIFQSFHLLPRATAVENVAQPLVYRGIPRALRREMAINALEKVGLGERLHHKPNEMSGGQRQRVAIARALVCSPSILLADEPTGNLDSRTTDEILSMIRDMHGAGQTIIMVTHEPEIAEQCPRIVRLQDGQIISDRNSRMGK